MDIEKKKQKEQRVVAEMIKIYCHGKHQTSKNVLCDECQELTRYAQQQSARCPFMKEKTFCANCTVHCYAPAMRTKIKQVMRYSGPRMLWRHPLLCIWHLITTRRSKVNV